MWGKEDTCNTFNNEVLFFLKNFDGLIKRHLNTGAIYVQINVLIAWAIVCHIFCDLQLYVAWLIQQTWQRKRLLLLFIKKLSFLLSLSTRAAMTKFVYVSNSETTLHVYYG